jgi:hypothetical protein
MSGLSRRSILKIKEVTKIDQTNVDKDRLKLDDSDHELDIDNLPQELEKGIGYGEKVVETLTEQGRKLESYKERFKKLLSRTMSLIAVVFISFLFAYFFESKWIVEMVFGLIAISLFLAIFWARETRLSAFNDPTDGRSWENFKKEFVYALRNVNKYVNLVLREEEHKLEIDNFKVKIRYTIKKLGYGKILNIENKIGVFKSSYENEEMWIDEFFDKIKDYLSISRNIFKLFYFESSNADSSPIYDNVKSKKEEYDQLKELLIQNAIVKIEDEEIEKQALSYILEMSRDFSIDNIQRKLDREVMYFKKLKQDALNLINIYLPLRPVSNIEENWKFNFARLENSFIDRINNIYEKDEEVLTFLLNDIRRESNGIKFNNSKWKEISFKRKLSDFLLAEGVIRTELNAEELTEVIENLKTFSLELFKNKISSFQEYFKLSRNFINFLNEIGMKSTNAEITINEISRIYDATDYSLERILEICESIIKKYDFMASSSLQQAASKYTTIAESTLAIYFNKIGDTRRKDLFKKISTNDDSAGILYYFATLKDTELLSSEYNEKLIIKAISGYDHDKITEERYFLQYKERLVNGILYTSIRELDSYKIEKIRRGIKTLSGNLNEFSSTESFKNALSELLEYRLKPNVVESLLEYGTVNAFLITKDSTTKEGKVWKFFEEITKDRIVMDKGSGSNTRFGLIPPVYTFESFTREVEKFYVQEVRNLEESSRKIYGKIVVNIYRFLPSKSFVATIGNFENKDIILKRIGKLIRQDDNPVNEKINILASLQWEVNAEKSIGSIIQTAINKINIFSFIQEKAKTEGRSFVIFSKLDDEKKQDLQKKVIYSYKVEDLSSFCKLLYREKKENKDNAKEIFRMKMMESLNRKNETGVFMDEIEFSFEKMAKLGEVLATIRN